MKLPQPLNGCSDFVANLLKALRGRNVKLLVLQPGADIEVLSAEQFAEVQAFRAQQHVARPRPWKRTTDRVEEV